MMRRNLMLLGVVVLAVFFTCAKAKADGESAQKGRIGAEFIFWWPTMSGDASFDAKIGELSIPGTSLDLEDTLGIDPTATTIELGVWLNPLKRYRLSLYWFLDKRDGTKILEQAATVAGDEYKVGAEINSELEINRFKLMNEFAILRNDLGRLAFGVGLVYVDATASISGIKVIGVQLLPDSTSTEIQAPLPVVGGAAELHIPFLMGLGLFAEGCGLALKYKEFKISYIDVRGGVNFKTRFVYAQGGYQYINLSMEAFDKLDAGLNMQGPFVSLGAKF